MVVSDVDLDNSFKLGKNNAKHILKNALFELARLTKIVQKWVWIWKSVQICIDLYRNSRFTAQRPLVGHPKLGKYVQLSGRRLPQG